MRHLTFIYSKDVKYRKRFDASLRTRKMVHPRKVWSADLPYATLAKALPDLRAASENGWALVGAPIDEGKTLNGESRADKINKNAMQDVLRLDFDGPLWPTSHRTPKPKLNHMLKAFGLDGVSSVVHWSASMGIKPGLRAHVLVELKTPVAHEAVVNWIARINAGPLRGLQKLTDSKLNISWALDSHLAHVSTLFFLGDPEFEDETQNPFQGRTRWESLCDNGRRYSLKNPGPVPKDTRVEILTELREKENLPALPPKLKTRRSGKHTVLVDRAAVDGVEVTDMWLDGDWIRCNLNHGDSCAYYTPVDNPRLLHSFKPDEPVYWMKDVCDNGEGEEDWAEVLRNLAKERKALQKKSVPSVMKQDQGITVVGVDQETGSYFVWMNSPTELGAPKYMTRHSAVDIFRSRTGAKTAPDPIQHWEMVYDPWEVQYDLERRLFNKYVPSAVEVRAGPWLTAEALIRHVIPEDAAREFFYDWLAYILQRRAKPITGLLMQGAMGTGKNLVIEEIAFPLVGAANTATISFGQLVASYTTYLAEKLLIHIEEVDSAAFTGHKGKEAQAIWRQLTTGGRLMSREIFQAHKEIDLRTAFILSSNSRAPLATSLDDRRVSYMPRQEQPLREADPSLLADGIDKLKQRLKSDLPGLARFLHDRKVESRRVNHPLRNEARDQALLDAVPIHEQVAMALAKNDGNFFLYAASDRELPGQPPGPLAGPKGEWAALVRMRYHDLLETLVDHAVRGVKHFLSVAEIAMLFKYVCEWEDDQRVGWITRRYGMTMKTIRKMDGVSRRGHLFKWKTDPAFLEEWRLKFADKRRKRPGLSVVKKEVDDPPSA